MKFFAYIPFYTSQIELVLFYDFFSLIKINQLYQTKNNIQTPWPYMIWLLATFLTSLPTICYMSIILAMFLFFKHTKLVPTSEVFHLLYIVSRTLHNWLLLIIQVSVQMGPPQRGLPRPPFVKQHLLSPSFTLFCFIFFITSLNLFCCWYFLVNYCLSHKNEISTQRSYLSYSPGNPRV